MQPQQSTSYTEYTFNEKYWFLPEQIITVRNPLNRPFDFWVESRHYQIAPGDSKPLTGFIANIYLDQMAKTVAQTNDSLGDIANPDLKAQYYDNLIVHSQNVIEEYQEAAQVVNTTPGSQDVQPFANFVPNNTAEPTIEATQTPTANVTPNAEHAFKPKTPVDSAEKTGATTTQAPETNVAQSQPTDEKAPDSRNRSFEYDGHKFALVYTDNQPTVSRDGIETTVDEYNKAASML